MKQMIHYLKTIKLRFKAINSIVKYLFLLTFISILITELYLINIESFNDLHFKIGSIYIKLCYSYVSAFLFYYLIVFIPKEKKKISSFVHINNKIMFIDKLLEQFLYIVVNEDDEHVNKVQRNLEKSDIESYIKNNWPPLGKNGGRSFSNLKLNDNSRINLKKITDKIIQNIDNVMLLNDLIDSELLYVLLSTKEKLEFIKDIKYYAVANVGMPDILITISDIHEINYLKLKILEIFRKKMINIYSYETMRRNIDMYQKSRIFN